MAHIVDPFCTICLSRILGSEKMAYTRRCGKQLSFKVTTVSDRDVYHTGHVFHEACLLHRVQHMTQLMGRATCYRCEALCTRDDVKPVFVAGDEVHGEPNPSVPGGDELYVLFFFPTLFITIIFTGRSSMPRFYIWAFFIDNFKYCRRIKHTTKCF